jgi:hypothetical protein
MLKKSMGSLEFREDGSVSVAQLRIRIATEVSRLRRLEGKNGAKLELLEWLKGRVVTAEFGESNKDANDCCAICLDTFVTNNEDDSPTDDNNNDGPSARRHHLVQMERCPHQFHADCLRGWIQSDAMTSNSCPCCRKVMK